MLKTNIFGFGQTKNFVEVNDQFFVRIHFAILIEAKYWLKKYVNVFKIRKFSTY